jgi:2-methylisocitrate lyase-like PEP mutase family enzyme
VESFRALHEGEPFVIPNPWDVGSAMLLESLGFKALATTSSGFAFTLGKPDGGATLDEVVEHVRLMAAAVGIPVAVDLENGYESPGETIARIAEAGAAGGSIEDWSGERLYEREEAAERVAEARAADADFVLCGRAENHLHGVDDLDDTIARLQAYSAAGADVLYAPGLRQIDQVRAICEAVDKPVNVLGHRGFASVGELFEAGAQRVSVGGALTWVAVAAARQAAEALRDGDLSVLAASAPKDLFA